MSIAIISTGTELLKGSVLNTNAGFIGRRLGTAGLRAALAITAGDSPRELFNALADALKAADTIIVTGGLGPTRDDLTLAAVARFFGCELHSDPRLREKVEQFWSVRHSGAPAPKSVLRQALIPTGATIIDNPNGSASGIRLDITYAGRLRHIFLLPGPPREFEPMFEAGVLPQLKMLLQPEEHEYTAGFLVLGCGEYSLQVKLEKLLKTFPVTLAYCARPEGTRVFLSGAEEAAVNEAVRLARSAIGEAAFPPGELELIPAIVRELERRNWTLVTAESCTGGRIAGAITDYAGVSAVFKGGAVVYSNELKHRLLGVPEELLAAHGAVSAECAQAMIDGACLRMEADCSIAVTGIAGPGGATETKPVGLVYIGVRVREQSEVREYHFPGDRRTVRERTAATALSLLCKLLRTGKPEEIR